MTDHSIKRKTVLIAGGAKNLGGLIARDPAEQGAKAIANHYKSAATKADADAPVAAIKAAGVEAVALQGDLTTAAAVVTLFAKAVAAIGRPDTAINTAGMVVKKPIPEITEADYDNIFAIKSKAAFFFIKGAGKHLNDGGKLCTIVTSLLGAFTGLYSIYAGSKAPAEHLTRAASKEFGSRGISVTAVAPEPMETSFFYGQETAESAHYSQNAADLSKCTKTGLTDPADIVTLVRYLVGEGWWITGQTILANGGYTTK